MEILEAEDIEETDTLEIGLLGHELGVDPLDKEREGAVVEQFGKSIACSHAFLPLHGSPDKLSRDRPGLE